MLVDHLQKNKERIQGFKETGDSQYIYQNKQDKACVQHDMAFGDFKDFARRTASDKILSDKSFNIAKNPKYAGYNRDLASLVYKYFDKKASPTRANTFYGSGVKNGNKSDQQFAEELHKPIIKKFKKLKVHLPFTNNISGADFADMQLISQFNRGFRFLLRVIDIYSKYPWVIPLQDKKEITITNVFQTILKESNRKSNKI